MTRQATIVSGTDLLRRYAELKEQQQEFIDKWEEINEHVEAEEAVTQFAEIACKLRDLARIADNFDEDEAEELSDLSGAYHDLQEDRAYILEDEFEQFAIQQMEDQGIDLSVWPNTCIDTERAADDLRADYTEITIGPNTYLTK